MSLLSLTTSSNSRCGFNPLFLNLSSITLWHERVFLIFFFSFHLSSLFSSQFVSGSTFHVFYLTWSPVSTLLSFSTYTVRLEFTFSLNILRIRKNQTILLPSWITRLCRSCPPSIRPRSKPRIKIRSQSRMSLTLTFQIFTPARFSTSHTLILFVSWRAFYHPLSLFLSTYIHFDLSIFCISSKITWYGNEYNSKMSKFTGQECFHIEIRQNEMSCDAVNEWFPVAKIIHFSIWLDVIDVCSSNNNT